MKVVLTSFTAGVLVGDTSENAALVVSMQRTVESWVRAGNKSCTDRVGAEEAVRARQPRY